MSDKKKPGQGGRKQKGKAATSNKPDVPQVAVAQAAPDASNNNASVNVNQKDGAATSPDTSKNMTEKLEDVADSKEGSESSKTKADNQDAALTELLNLAETKKQEVTKLEQVVAEQKAEIQKLKTQLESQPQSQGEAEQLKISQYQIGEKDKQIEQLQKDLSEKSAAVALSTTEKDAVAAELAEISKELAETSEKLKIAQAGGNDVGANLVKSQKAEEELKKQVAEVTEQLKQFAGSAEVAKKEIAELNERLNSTGGESEKKLSEAKATVAKLEKEIADSNEAAKTAISAKDGEIAQLKEQVASLTENISALKSASSDSTNIVEEKLAKITELEGKLSQAKEEIYCLQDVESNNKKLTEKVNEKEVEIAAQNRIAEEKLKEEVRKRTAIEMDIAKVQNELDASKAAGRTLEKTISELNFSLSEQNSELRKLRTELDETKDANSREIQGAKLDAQKEGEHQLHQLQITIEEKERIIAELKTKEWESKDFETQRLYKEIAALQSKLETRNAAANNFRKQFLELQLELSANLDKAREADEILRTAEDRNKRITELEAELQLTEGKKSQYETLTKRLGELQNALTEKKTALQALRDDTQVKDQEITNLKAEVRAVKRLVEERDAQIMLLKKQREVVADKLQGNLNTDVLSSNFAYDIRTDSDESDVKNNPLVVAHEEKLNARKLYEEISEKLAVTQHAQQQVEAKLTEELEAHRKTLAEQEVLNGRVTELELNLNASRLAADNFRAQFLAEEKARIQAEASLKLSKQQNDWLEKKLLKAKLVEVDNRQLTDYNHQMKVERDQALLNALRAEELRAKAQNDADVAKVKMEGAVARAENVKVVLLAAKDEAVEEVTARLNTAELEIKELRKNLKEFEDQVVINRTNAGDQTAKARGADRRLRTVERQLEDTKIEAQTKDVTIKDLEGKIEGLKKRLQQVVLEKEDFCSQATLLSHKLGLKTSP